MKMKHDHLKGEGMDDRGEFLIQGEVDEERNVHFTKHYCDDDEPAYHFRGRCNGGLTKMEGRYKSEDDASGRFVLRLQNDPKKYRADEDGSLHRHRKGEWEQIGEDARQWVTWKKHVFKVDHEGVVYKRNHEDGEFVQIGDGCKHLIVTGKNHVIMKKTMGEGRDFWHLQKNGDWEQMDIVN